MATDIFQRQQVLPIKPVTADQCTIIWEVASGGGSAIVTAATNVSIQYQQQVTRRRTLGAANGRPLAVIYPSQPQGTMQIQRLVAEGADNILNRKGFSSCDSTGTITIHFRGEAAYGCTVKGPIYVLSGIVVTSFGFTAEAESLTVVDNITVEFLQMSSESNAASTTNDGGLAPGVPASSIGQTGEVGMA